MSSLAVEHLSKSFPTPTGPLVVLEDVSLELLEGESLAVRGPSGSGKSTLLHVLGTLDTPTRGTVRLGGVDPFALPPAELAQFRNQKIGFIFQEHYLLPQLNVWHNVLVPALASGTHVSETTCQRAQLLLQRVGLLDRLGHLPHELSGGQRQRVAVVRALLLEPLLILADEPTGNLDPENGRSICDLLLELLTDESAMLITVTHSDDIAGRMQRQVLLENRTLTS